MRLVPDFLRPRPDTRLRPADSASRTALLFATALNLGFQAAQSIMIYPELFRDPGNLRSSTGGPALEASIAERQKAHVKRSVPMLATMYPIMGASAVWAAVVARESTPGPGRAATLVAAAAALGTPALTAAVTTPLHVRISQDPTPGRVHSLLAADRVRTALAAFGVVSAVRGLRPR